METLGCEEFESWLDVHDFSSEVCQAFKGTSSIISSYRYTYLHTYVCSKQTGIHVTAN